MREYKIMSREMAITESDSLLCDISAIGPSDTLFLYVRIPKRRLEERIQLLKDASTRRRLVFPEVGVCPVHSDPRALSIHHPWHEFGHSLFVLPDSRFVAFVGNCAPYASGK